MTQPVLIGLSILEDRTDRLAAVQAGDDYRMTFANVGNEPQPVDMVEPAKTPWWAVVTGPGTEAPQMSHRSESTVDVVAQGYIYRDPDRWPETATSILSWWMLGDLIKAWNSDVACGVQAILQRRQIDMKHDLQGRFSVIVVRDTYEFRKGLTG